MIWLAFALMTTATVLALVWPLATRHRAPEGTATDLRFYADLLGDVDGDIARGLVSPGEADVTRAEIGRRLLAAARTGEASATSSRGVQGRRLAAIAVAVALVPIISLAGYLRIGNPRQPDEPLAARAVAPSSDFASAVAKIEAHLVAHPDDGRGFEVIAPVFLRMGRPEDAATAYRATIRLLGDSADREASLGEAMTMAADGVVTADARAVFDKALVLNPGLPQARFYTAIAAEQDGDKPKAVALLQALLADSPSDAPWRGAVDQRLAVLSGRAPAPSGPVLAQAPPTAGVPSGPAAEAIAAMPSDQRLQAIRGMVEGLAARLAQNGRDGEGWLRLIKAYTVLGDGDKARKALQDAQRDLADDPPSLARLHAAARELGLEG